MRRLPGIRLALSGWLLFHLLCITVAPNSQNYLGALTKPVVEPYVSLFELASQWGFFAPDPGPPPVFIEYEAVGPGGGVLGTGAWPEKKDPFFLRERQNRRIAVARFMMISEERTTRMMGPHVCRLYPTAQSVRLWQVMVGMANLHDVANGKRAIGDGVGTKRKWVTQYLCGGPA